MSTAKTCRLQANPCIGVSDLMGPLIEFQKINENQEIAKIVMPTDENSVSWKTAPNIAWLLSLKDLFASYIGIAPNGVLGQKKHKMAIEKIVKEGMECMG